MTRPTSSAKYPASMLAAMRRAHDVGEFVIPCDNPQALRLRFYGLGGALRKEQTPELFDALTFIVQKEPPALVIRLTDNTDFAKTIEAALAATNPQPSALSQAEDMLARLMGEKP